MTAIRAKTKVRTILDFSTGKCTKNRIKQALRTCEIIHSEETPREHFVYLNQIRVGMYTIIIVLPFDSSNRCKRLREYGDFQVYIYDTEDQKKSAIPLAKDGRFKNQYWVSKNVFGKLRIKHLIDIIAYCHRLNKLRAFL